mgnify:FL=1
MRVAKCMADISVRVWSVSDFLHFLYMSRTDKRLYRQRHGHRHKRVKIPDCEELIILALLFVVGAIWVLSGG